MKNYYVEGIGWFVVKTHNKRQAKSVGVQEFGRGNVREIREASQSEVSYFCNLKGQAALEA